ncbi:hypothetical protein [Actinomadura yumaensis]|uniref:hypothetical protein n=1 Tax=Actinomadura yumaensis TaxID=111807 RepID=UPI0036097836
MPVSNLPHVYTVCLPCEVAWVGPHASPCWCCGEVPAGPPARLFAAVHLPPAEPAAVKAAPVAMEAGVSPRVVDGRARRRTPERSLVSGAVAAVVGMGIRVVVRCVRRNRATTSQD